MFCLYFREKELSLGGGGGGGKMGGGGPGGGGGFGPPVT